MKRIIIVLFSIILSSCIQYPVYHSHTQVVDVSQIRQQYPQAEIIYDGNIQHGDKIELFRSWFDKELVVKQKGFKDKHINIESIWTDDAWAEGSCIGMGCSTNKKSTLSLLSPNQALWIPVGLVGIISTPIGMITSPFSEVKENFKISVKALFLYPYNLISVIGLPLVNPWREYNITEIPEKFSLEATEDLKYACNKKGYFLSNLGCLECSSEMDLIPASDLECTRCPNRKIQDGFCSEVCSQLKGKDGMCYSCSWSISVDTTEEECAKCTNREYRYRRCILKK